MDQHKITLTSNGEPKPDPSGTGMVEPAAPSGAFSVGGGCLEPSAGKLWIVKAWGDETRFLKPEAAITAVREYLSDGATLVCVEVCESPAPDNIGSDQRAAPVKKSP